MKLLYCAGSTIPSDSANSIHVMRMCEALAELGHDVTLIAKQTPASAATAEVFQRYGMAPCFNLVRVAFRGRQDLMRYLLTARRTGAVDALIGRYIYPIWALRGNARQFMYESHEPPHGLRARIERQLLRDERCAGLPVISQALLDRYTERFDDLASERCFVLPDAAVDTGAAPPPRPNGRLVIGYAGSDYTGRGIDVIVACASALPECEFRIAGATSSAVKAASGSQPPNLTCLGRLDHADVPNFLKACDVLLAPYQRSVAVSGNTGNTIDWCSPLKLFEYLAQGKAIVCSDLPALREVLNDSNAILVTPDDTAEWISALRQLDVDRTLAQRLGTRAREDFTAHYTWKIRATKIIDRLR